MLGPESWIALVGQTVLIVASIVASAVRTEKRITKLETKVEHVEAVQQDGHQDSEKLEEQVQGISRSLAALEGAHRACPYWAIPAERQPPNRQE